MNRSDEDLIASYESRCGLHKDAEKWLRQRKLLALWGSH